MRKYFIAFGLPAKIGCCIVLVLSSFLQNYKGAYVNKGVKDFDTGEIYISDGTKLYIGDRTYITATNKVNIKTTKRLYVRLSLKRISKSPKSRLKKAICKKENTNSNYRFRSSQHRILFNYNFSSLTASLASSNFQLKICFSRLLRTFLNVSFTICLTKLFVLVNVPYRKKIFWRLFQRPPPSFFSS